MFWIAQEALSVYKEAVKKMPRQFAPQSLYNMMGEWKEGFLKFFAIAWPLLHFRETRGKKQYSVSGK